MNVAHEVKRTSIYLLTEGMLATVIESQVMVHINLMRKAGIPLELWTFALSRESYKKTMAMLPQLARYGVPTRVIRGERPTWPGSEIVNTFILGFTLWRNHARPFFIHARGEYSMTLASHIKRLFSVRLIWDARGDSVSEFELTSSLWPVWKRPVARFVLKDIRRRRRRALRYADRVIFVSQELRKLLGEQLDLDKTTVLPCAADEESFQFDPALRSATRSQLGFASSDIVILYSGSTAAWQCVPETVNLMSQALASAARYRALIVTSDPGTFERMISPNMRSRFIVTSCALPKMNSYLNAADIGVMLRERNRINLVASPVKFAEYSLTGLLIIATSAVEQAQALGERIGNLVESENIDWEQLATRFPDVFREARAHNAIEWYGRNALKSQYLAIYQ